MIVQPQTSDAASSYEIPRASVAWPGPEYSAWRCELFGGGVNGIVWYPLKGQEPNRFHRFMQRLCFGCRWVRT